MEARDVVRAWTAACARDADALVALAEEGVVLETRRGRAHGVDALREAVARQSYGVRLYVGPQDVHVIDDIVISVGPVELRQLEEGDRSSTGKRIVPPRSSSGTAESLVSSRTRVPPPHWPARVFPRAP